MGEHKEAFNMQYGYVEARIQFPYGTDYGPLSGYGLKIGMKK
jgi:hypothetical protein